MITWRPVNSSNIEAVGWPTDAYQSLTIVQFKGGRVYAYPGVPRQRALAMIRAQSVGRYFAKNIRPLPAMKLRGVRYLPEQESETVGERLRRLRFLHGLSQRELQGPGMSYAYISRIEAGERSPSVKALVYLASRLGVTAKYLAGYGEHETCPFCGRS